MKFKLLTTGLLVGLLVGCSGTKQDTTVTSTLESQQASKSRVTEPNEFDRVSFPLESCGEKLPNDPKAYPVKYYPVFIDYSEGNLQSIKSKYCKDARKKIRKPTGKDAIQVASFSSSERANKFQKFMINKIGSGEVGEPTVIEAKRTTEVIDTKAGFNLSVAKAAKLTPEQVKQLVFAKGKDYRGINIKIEAVVPTYIPSGFQVYKFEVKNVLPYGPRYKIYYRNSSNSCFSIRGGAIDPTGNEPSGLDTVEVSSPALGKVFLAYIDFERTTSKSYISFEPDQISGIRNYDNSYYFTSPAFGDSCNRISLQEAIKTVESLQYLNP